MNNVIRFGWIGETRRAALQTLIAAVVEDWARDWWMGFADGLVNVRSIDELVHTERREHPLLCADDAGAIAVHLSGKDSETVGRYLGGVTSDGDAELSQRIGEESLNQLALRIRQRAGITKAVAFTRLPCPLELQHSRLGAFALSAAVGRLQLGLVIDRRIADRLAPPIAAKHLGLVSRTNALESALLHVAAYMDFGAVDLAQLADLSVGEILVGDCKLDEPISIHVQGHGAVASGFLRRLDERRAVMLHGIPSKEKHHE
jgi:hypothetical protein